jgi:hypothetical protein
MCGESVLLMAVSFFLPWSPGNILESEWRSRYSDQAEPNDGELELVSWHGQGIFFFASRRSLRSHSILCSGYRSFPCWSSGWAVKVITHLHVVLRLKMRGIYPHTPSNPLMVWCFITQGTNLPKPLGILNCYFFFFFWKKIYSYVKLLFMLWNWVEISEFVSLCLLRRGDWFLGWVNNY